MTIQERFYRQIEENKNRCNPNIVYCWIEIESESENKSFNKRGEINEGPTFRLISFNKRNINEYEINNDFDNIKSSLPTVRKKNIFNFKIFSIN